MQVLNRVKQFISPPPIQYLRNVNSACIGSVTTGRLILSCKSSYPSGNANVCDDLLYCLCAFCTPHTGRAQIHTIAKLLFLQINLFGNINFTNFLHYTYLCFIRSRILYGYLHASSCR